LLLKGGYHTTVETNGTKPEMVTEAPMVNLWSVSPKLPGSQANGKLEERAKVSVVKWIKATRHAHRKLQLKFVVTDLWHDLEAINTLLEPIDDWQNEELFLQPNGDWWNNSHEEGWSKYAELLDAVESFYSLSNARVLPQVHMLAFGRKRYV